MNIQYSDREQLALALITWAATTDDDQSGLRTERVRVIATDFLTNYGDLAQADRWNKYANELHDIGRKVKACVFRSHSVAALVSQMASQMKTLR